jgi:hypothetical protein
VLSWLIRYQQRPEADYRRLLGRRARQRSPHWRGRGVNRVIFAMMRLRSSFMSSGSHFNFFHTLRAFLPKALGLESNSWYFSNVSFRFFSTFRHPLAISYNSICCWPVSSRSGKRSSISRRTLESPLTLSSSNNHY